MLADRWVRQFALPSRLSLGVDVLHFPKSSINMLQCLSTTLPSGQRSLLSVCTDHRKLPKLPMLWHVGSDGIFPFCGRCTGLTVTPVSVEWSGKLVGIVSLVFGDVNEHPFTHLEVTTPRLRSWAFFCAFCAFLMCLCAKSQHLPSLTPPPPCMYQELGEQRGRNPRVPAMENSIVGSWTADEGGVRSARNQHYSLSSTNRQSRRA